MCPKKNHGQLALSDPGAAWVLLILFAVSANVLIGYNIRGLRGSNIMILILPLLTTMALFMIAEIDIRVKGLFM